MRMFWASVWWRPRITACLAYLCNCALVTSQGQHGPWRVCLYHGNRWMLQITSSPQLSICHLCIGQMSYELGVLWIFHNRDYEHLCNASLRNHWGEIHPLGPQGLTSLGLIYLCFPNSECSIISPEQSNDSRVFSRERVEPDSIKVPWNVQQLALLISLLLLSRKLF
jgi:hypothetical protein